MNALSGVTYLDWHPSIRPVIGESVVASTPQLGAKVSANSESAGLLALDPPTSSHLPWQALMYCRAKQPKPGLLSREAALCAVLLLLTMATSSSVGLFATFSVILGKKVDSLQFLHNS